MNPLEAISSIIPATNTESKLGHVLSYFFHLWTFLCNLPTMQWGGFLALLGIAAPRYSLFYITRSII